MNEQILGNPVRAYTSVSSIAGFAYSLAAYGLFLAAFTLFGVVVNGIWMPWANADAGNVAVAVAINTLLVGSFALQHTIMARASFKERWTKIVPASVERTTFVVVTSLLMLGILFFWQPLPGTLWHVETPWLRNVLRGGFVAGFLGVVGSSFLINHFHLFGLQQTWRRLRGLAPADPVFREPWAYRRVRHPMMTSVLVMVWSAPTMSASQALMAGLFSAYALVGVLFEERELSEMHGADYNNYRERVRWRVIPGLY